MPADTAGKVALNVIKKECKNLTCCFQAGDSTALQQRVVERIDQKLKHRVSDGAEVRGLEAKVHNLEKALTLCLVAAVARKDRSEIDRIKTVLKKDKLA